MVTEQTDGDVPASEEPELTTPKAEQAPPPYDPGKPDQNLMITLERGLAVPELSDGHHSDAGLVRETRDK